MGIFLLGPAAFLSWIAFASGESVTKLVPLIVFILFLGSLGSHALSQALSNSIYAIIDDRGIYFQKWKCEMIPWEDIDGLGTKEHKFLSYRSNVLEIYLKSPSSYKSKLHVTSFNRLAMFKQDGSKFYPIQIAFPRMNYDSEEVALFAFRMWLKNKQAKAE